MQSQSFSSTLIGVQARLVTVETVVTSGLPGLTVVGLPDAAVSEAGARVRSSLKLSQVTLPPRRMVVNLAPADLRKSGSGFDLALALGLLEALGEIPESCLRRTLVIGELSLSGHVRGVRGVVSSLALAAENSSIDRILLPACQLTTLPRWEGVEIVGVSTLAEAIKVCRGEGQGSISSAAPKTLGPGGPDLSEVRGQSLAKLALRVSAAGGHHFAMVGPPGCGKSLLARCLPSLLPPMTEAEQRDVAVIRSVCQEEGCAEERPFRSPGHLVSAVALLGGQHPGEVTRAHHGVLFLDEFPEFRRDALESLRAVLESGEVNVSRARFKTVYPAQFTLVCAMNPCPCGMSGVPEEFCRCSSSHLARYRSKLSGPLLDRFDLMVGLQRVPLESVYSSAEPATPSEEVAKSVERARELQLARGQLNRDLRGQQLTSAIGWKASDRDLAFTLAEKGKLSMRAFEKWLRVARTLADLDLEPRVGREHLLRARAIRFSGGEERLAV